MQNHPHWQHHCPGMMGRMTGDTGTRRLHKGSGERAGCFYPGNIPGMWKILIMQFPKGSRQPYLARYQVNRFLSLYREVIQGSFPLFPSFFPCIPFMILFTVHAQRKMERETQRDSLSIDSLPKYPQWLGLAQAKPRRQEDPPQVRKRVILSR